MFVIKRVSTGLPWDFFHEKEETIKKYFFGICILVLIRFIVI